MAEYIDRERLKQCFHANICGGNAYDELIDMQPTADVIERSKIDNVIEQIEEEAFPESVYGEQYGSMSPVISVDAVVEILKRNIGE